MTARISETLEVLRDVADHYRPQMSDADVRQLRIEALDRVSKLRKIHLTTVSDKFRRQLQPAIHGTAAFDHALFNWLDSRSTTLRLALEQNTVRPEDLARIHDFFEADSIREQVIADLEALHEEEGGVEGGKKSRLISYFERDPALRAAAIAVHGTTCKACGFNFEAVYGAHGKNYIEVHHIVPISTLSEPSTINAKDDMIVLCSNCHRMVHRKRDASLSIEELSGMLSENSSVKKRDA